MSGTSLCLLRRQISDLDFRNANWGTVHAHDNSQSAAHTGRDCIVVGAVGLTPQFLEPLLKSLKILGM